MRPVLSPPAEERETTLGSQPAGTFTGPTYLGDPLGWTCSGVEGGTLSMPCTSFPGAQTSQLSQYPVSPGSVGPYI